ncbi:MAG: cysteine desulfurase [Nitrososphaerota archaeon]|nr:cysteine desulfurase [Nitrososphaerota archaeon]
MDNQATTPVDKRVLEAMLPYFNELYANASSTDHRPGAAAAAAVENARTQVASIVGAKEEEIVFTSGATESDNLALQGVAVQLKEKGNHIITCATEHKAVLDACEYLHSRGWSVTVLPVDSRGDIDLKALESEIRPETVLISLMLANNEIGTILLAEEVGRIAKDHGVLFHTDAAQAVGHIPVDVNRMSIDLMSISGHKVYGPKGVGALFIRRHNPRVKLTPLVYGGGQERGLRSGTLNVPGIVGLGKALEIANREMNSEAKRLSGWTSTMRTEFVNAVEGAEQNGHPTRRLPHNLNMFFPGVESKAVIQAESSDLAMSAGSACTTNETKPSHVILALGFGPERAHSSIRFGLGRFNTEEEVRYAIDEVVEVVHKLQKIRVA